MTLIYIYSEGYESYSELLTLNSGETKRVKAKLAKKRGLINISSEPSGANILINGKQEFGIDGKSIVTPNEVRLFYGEHNITLELENYFRKNVSLKIEEPNLGVKKFILKPLPGRIVINVLKNIKMLK